MSSDISFPSVASPLFADHLCQSYERLSNSTSHVLRAQLGASQHLVRQRRDCELLLPHVYEAQRVSAINNATAHTLLEGITSMISCLDDAIVQSADPASTPAGHLENQHLYTGRPGRPALVIPESDLAILGQGRTSNVELGELFNCHSRTIRHRKLEYGQAAPGPPVMEKHTLTDGTQLVTYRPGQSSALSDLTDEQLDKLILQIYHQFPKFGRRMIDGYLMAMGERVPRRRIIEAYHRVLGPSPNTFATRRVLRQTYRVPGPNLLWHHDGQHGLIRWKIVLHGFVDGYSRLVLGLRASNNNRATTVLSLFDDIVAQFGYPSRVRGDHGTENLYVAREMELVQGADRGSYIFGRSVHNIRIERLWVDVTKGFGGKWKDFFRRLETSGALDVNNDNHIWLLHFVFLPEINYDCEVWGDAWNQHIISSTTEPHRSPIQKYTHGLVTQGIRGTVLDASDIVLTDEEQEGYGIDWDDMSNQAILTHHRDNNEDGAEDGVEGAFHTAPPRLSHVEVPDLRCPFAPEQLDELNEYLEQLPHRHEPDDNARRNVWTLAVAAAEGMFDIMQ